MQNDEGSLCSCEEIPINLVPCLMRFALYGEGYVSFGARGRRGHDQVCRALHLPFVFIRMIQSAFGAEAWCMNHVADIWSRSLKVAIL